MKTLIAAMMLTMTAAGQAPLVLDCTHNPICPQDKVCQCIKGTYHPSPSFVEDDRYGTYRFTIQLENHIGWSCNPSIEKDRVTVTCVREPKSAGK